MGWTEKGESIKSKTQNNGHNIYERKHSENLLLFAFISTSHWQSFTITSEEYKVFKMLLDE